MYVCAFKSQITRTQYTEVQFPDILISRRDTREEGALLIGWLFDVF